MKDEYKRRRKAEQQFIKTFPDVEENRVYTPIHQECLHIDSNVAMRVCAQGNELIAVSTRDWSLQVYALNNDDNNTPLNRDSISEISEFSDDGLIPNRRRTPLWCGVPRTSSNVGSVEFIAQDVIAFLNPDTPGIVSTWYVGSNQCLERVFVRGSRFDTAMCKISDIEFVVGSEEGHLYTFNHEGGCNLQQTARIWKAHTLRIMFVAFHKDTIVTTSSDHSARLWNLTTKRKLAVLYHNRIVHSAAISDQYIVTCSWYGRTYYGKGELRIFHNSNGFAIVKILRYCESLLDPIFLDSERILCRTFGDIDDINRPIVRNSLMIVDIENESLTAQLKVGCRALNDFTILADGRIVAVGCGGCRGVVIMPPSKMRKLIGRSELRDGRRRMCTLM